MYKEHKLWEDYSWISVTDPSEKDFSKIQKKFKLPRMYRSYILDPHERSRFDFNEEIKMGLLIWRVTVPMKEESSFKVMPISFIVSDKHLISAVNKQTAWINKYLEDILHDFNEKDEEKPSLPRILLRLLWRINNHYVDQIDQVNKWREELANYRKRPTNHQIEALSHLSDQLVYLTTAADNNVVAIQQMRLSSNSDTDEFKVGRREQDLMNDVEIETKQSQQITRDAAELVDRLSNTYNNILNNNLNDTMRFLTIWSLILAAPPVISGFYGMNMHLPWARGEWAWTGTLVMTLALVILTLWVYYRYRSK